MKRLRLNVPKLTLMHRFMCQGTANITWRVTGNISRGEIAFFHHFITTVPEQKHVIKSYLKTKYKLSAVLL